MTKQLMHTVAAILLVTGMVLETRANPPVPPPMPQRAIAPPATAPAGEQIQLDDDGTKYTLFIPAGWEAPDSGDISIIAHFHGAVWFAIDEHLRHGLNEPLICFALGEGSRVYGEPFKDRERFGRIIHQTEEALRRTGAPAGTRIVRIDISSFSAGYGAVREIVQVPEYVKLIRRIVLADSLYAGWDPATTQPGATSRPSAENMDPWLPFVQAAAHGDKTFVLTHSQVPTPYANTEACARWLIEAVGAEIKPIEPGSLPATEDPDFPLLYRADLNGFHVWGYGGVDGPAHMTHPRHIADIWMALDEADRTRHAAPGAAGASGEIRRGVPRGTSPEQRQRDFAGRIEPDLRGDPAKVGVYLRFFEREVVKEKRLFAWNVAADVDKADNRVTLRGQAEFPEQVAPLVALLETLGFDVNNRIEMMPTRVVLGGPHGIVRAPRSFIYGAPAEPREVVNEVVEGETLFLLHASEDASMYLVHAPDAYVGWIHIEDVQPVDEKTFTRAINRKQPDPRVETVIAAAEEKLGLPYVWGGRSDGGVDCSGLVQTAFAAAGVYLPRDAEQQAIVGKLVATRWHRDALRRGDVLFFLGRRGTVSHTAIYLGDGLYIEAAGSVRLSSFDPGHENYSASRHANFCFAKRMLQ